jgi:hypothetical protein
MRSSRIAISLMLLLSGLVWLHSTATSADTHTMLPSAELPFPINDYHETDMSVTSSVASEEGGLKEQIPSKYLNRYEEWKKEFLSTETGRTQWASFANNPNFTLTITIARDNAEGAATGKYRWNDAGDLVAATITLGVRLDDGYPNPIYFPVMNSLVPTGSSYQIGGHTLAATKIAHEFGHVMRTRQIDPKLYQLQTQLIPHYNKIFLSNGRNANDPILLELVSQIGGTPVQIWEDREYWGETNAMVYLRDRFTDEGTRCALFNRIRHRVDLYAKGYEKRFFDIARSNSSSRLCGW